MVWAPCGRWQRRRLDFTRANVGKIWKGIAPMKQQVASKHAKEQAARASGSWSRPARRPAELRRLKSSSKYKARGRMSVTYIQPLELNHWKVKPHLTEEACWTSRKRASLRLRAIPGVAPRSLFRCPTLRWRCADVCLRASLHLYCISICVCVSLASQQYMQKSGWNWQRSICITYTHTRDWGLRIALAATKSASHLSSAATLKQKGLPRTLSAV